MELKITKNKYSASNNVLFVDDDAQRVEAHSYDWWRYVTTDDVGNVIFNNASYSRSTSQHQASARGILRKLGIRPALVLRNTLIPLDYLESAINDEIGLLVAECDRNLRKITSKGTHKATNESRVSVLNRRVDRILELQRFQNQYLNKKKYSFKIDEHGPQILKKNGKLNHFDTKIAANRTESELRLIPSNTKTVCKKWNISFNPLDLQIYPHTHDVIEMLNDNDSRDKKLREKVKKLARARNTLALDKIHTFFVNRANRALYTPPDKKRANQVQYTVNPILFNIEYLRPIVNRYQLKKEGRQQSHCIGTCSSYHKKIATHGYHAFNYKNYTFFTDPDLNILECYGRHNAMTPNFIVRDLKHALSEALSNNSRSL